MTLPPSKDAESAFLQIVELLPRIEHEDAKFCATALHDINNALRKYPEIGVMLDDEQISTILGGGIIRHVAEIQAQLSKPSNRPKKANALESALLDMMGKQDTRGPFDKGSPIELEF